jgi:ankyrin repeat protein
MKNDTHSEKLKKTAIILTLLCVVANIPLFAFILFGPKDGMEELGILFPWFLTGTVHITLFLPAVLFARYSRRHRANLWIYSYFILFFGFHIIFLAHTSGLDTRIHQKFTSFWHPDQAELHELLSELRYIPSDEKTARAKALILAGVDVNAMIPGDNQSALQKAAYMGNPQIIRLLLERGAPVSGPPQASTTPLGWAVQQNHTKAVRLLLDNGAEPNEGVSGYSFLKTAIDHQNLEMMTDLLKAGADPDKRIYRPESPLMIAALRGYTPILEALLKAGADPDFQLPNGQTALVMAVKERNSECVNALLNAGAKLIGNDFRNTGLLALAAISGNPEVTTRIEKEVKSRSHSDNNGDSLYRDRYRDLFNALNDNRLDDFKKMLRIGISPDSTNDHGNSLLQAFCQGSLRRYYKHLNTLDAAKILIENSADINRSSKDGTTPLMNAARTGQMDMVKLLIDHGAQINAKNKSGHNALYYAMAEKQEAIAKVLLSSGAKQYQKDSE